MGEVECYTSHRLGINNQEVSNVEDVEESTESSARYYWFGDSDHPGRLCSNGVGVCLRRPLYRDLLWSIGRGGRRATKS